MSKKFFLSVDQRKTLIEALLKHASDLENEIKAGKVNSALVFDHVEAEIQKDRHLADLFKVQEHEL